MATRSFAKLLACVAAADALRERRQGGKRQSSASLLTPVSTAQPDPILFPPRDRYPLEPAFTEVQGAKHTNKFWGNWVVDDGQGDFSIYPSPYTLRWKRDGSSIDSLYVMKGETDYSPTFFTSHWIPDFNLGAVEKFADNHVIVKEQHFGIHAQVRPASGHSCQMTVPIFAGMAYVSAKMEDCTTTITTNNYLSGVEKVSNGIFKFVKDHNKEYRVYLLKDDGEFADDSYAFSSTGVLNKKFNGWVRLAHVHNSGDRVVLDNHAQKILVGWELEITEGEMEYKFDTIGSGKFLNWVYANHMHFLSGGASEATDLTRTRSPVKGLMWALSGDDTWKFTVDLAPALDVDFMPREEPRAEFVDDIKTALAADYAWFQSNWRLSLHKRDHYFSGKGFQKLGQVCHMMAKFYGKADPEVQNCANILKEGFQCLWDRNVSDGSDRRLAGPDGQWSQEQGCWWSPFGTWYDLSWGGLPSRWDDSPTCGLDFGNSCFNDHHYHWGYFVVSAAMLVDLIPSMKNEARFVEFVNMFIRDVANPSTSDMYFPQFRAFDFFDMHSWSRGLKPDPSGKDQESTSEEVNFHFGVLLWGKMIGNDKMKKLGATILTLASRSLQDYYLMKRDNPNHPPSFAINHVTGIFFQNKVHLTTWFGQDRRYIHGIQMLPLTAGLILSRKDDFAFEEWNDQLQGLPINHADPWWSILLSGNMAMWNPDAAWGHLMEMDRSNMDDGLTKSWALYWTSVQKADGPRPTPAPTTAAPPTPAPGGGGGGGGGSGIFCNPNPALNQRCPGNIPCPQCGNPACECPR